MTVLLAAAVCMYQAGWGDVAVGAAAALGTVFGLAIVAFVWTR